jgi:hypothetical protein
MVCTAKIQNDGSVDLGIQFTGGAGNKSFGMPSGKNDWGMQVTVSGCGDTHQVLLHEHDTDRNRGQNTMVFQDGTHWLHYLYGGVTAAEVNEVPLSTKAVGYQDIYYISDYGVKNGMHQLFGGGYQMVQNQWYTQSEICPDGGEVWPMSMHNEHGGTHNKKHRYACVYPKTAAKLKNVESLTRGKLNRPMYEDMVTRYCSDSNNIFEQPGTQSCLERTTGVAIAKQYCGVSNRIHSDSNCTKENLTEAGYNSVAAAYCEANPNDSFCSCYNVLNDKCDPTSKTGPAGCSDTGSYVDLRNATPDDFKSVWDGQRKCGSVCAGANKYIPANNQAGCKTTIQICKQDIDVGSMSESDIKASCELNAGDGSSVGGGGGGGGGGDTEEEVVSLTDFRTNPKSYIPNSIEGLKTSRKQQLGVGGVGGVVMMMCCCMLMLLLLSSGGPAARRFSR